MMFKAQLEELIEDPLVFKRVSELIAEELAGLKDENYLSEKLNQNVFINQTKKSYNLRINRAIEDLLL